MPDQDARTGIMSRWRWSRVIVVAGVCAAAAITVQSLFIGLVGDDLVHRQFLLDHLESRAAPGTWWNMFDMRLTPALVEFGYLPWWTSPNLQMAFLRTVATISHYFDYLLWPTHPALMHLHNVFIYLGVVATASLIYQRFLSGPWCAGVATLLYATDDAHALGAAWIASRNTLLTAFFSLLCLALYARGREAGSRLGIGLAAGSLLLAHASSEGAIAVWGYLIAYALFIDSESAPRRIRALLPLVAVSGTWLGVAAALGYGVRGGGAYLDPRQVPLRFLEELPHRLPPLLLAQFGVTEELGAKLPKPALEIAHAFTWALLVAILVHVARVWRTDRVTRFFVVGCVSSLLPICAVGPIGRLLYLSGLGAHALIAHFVVTLFLRHYHRPVRAIARSYALLVLAVSVATATYGASAGPKWWADLHHHFLERATTLPRGDSLSHSTIMAINARDYLATPFIMLYRRIFAAPGPPIMHILGVSTDSVRVTRLDDSALVLTPEHGYLNDRTSILVRSRAEKFSVGDEFRLRGATVRVEVLTTDGRPAQVRVQTPALEDPNFVWVVWDDQSETFKNFALPEIGQAIVLPGLGPAR